MSVSGTYSFLNTLVAMSGPGALSGFDLTGAGFASEAIKVTMNGDADAMTIGAAGDGMHSLSASQAGRVTISLLKTGPGNALLSALYNYQKQSAVYWGQNNLNIRNPVSGDAVTCVAGAFVKHADVGYDVAGPLLVWEFNFVEVVTILGNGYQYIREI